LGEGALAASAAAGAVGNGSLGGAQALALRRVKHRRHTACVVHGACKRVGFAASAKAALTGIQVFCAYPHRCAPGGFGRPANRVRPVLRLSDGDDYLPRRGSCLALIPRPVHSGTASRSIPSRPLLQSLFPTQENDMNTVNTASSVISSDKVQGTKVYNPNGDKLGSVESLLLDKLTGKVRYAVMEFGGFLGMGTDVYPLPWETLKYDTGLGGYVVSLTKEQLEGAPRYARETTQDYNDEYGRKVNEYYGVPWI